jgi:hypothetical protein
MNAESAVGRVFLMAVSALLFILCIALAGATAHALWAVFLMGWESFG